MIGQFFLPTHIILTAVILWILPVVRVIESRTEKWMIKAYLSIVWSIVLLVNLVVRRLNMQETIVFYPLGGTDYREIEFVLTETNLTLLIFVTLLFCVIMIYSLRYLRWESLATDQGDYKMYYYFLMFASYLGLSIVLVANDAFTIFVGWEIMVVPAYGLVATRHKSKSAEAGIKYALQSSIGSIFLLYGISVLYEVTGTFNISQIQSSLSSISVFDNILLWQAMVFILIGVGVTAGIIGFHTWIPDAYGEAPSTVGAFVSGSFTIASTVVIYQLILLPFSQFNDAISTVLIYAGILTMTVGNLGAIRQQDVRRLLGYSSIAQRGYILFGLGVIADVAINLQEGITIVYIQALSYLLLEGVLFLAVGNLIYLFYRHIENRDLDLMKGTAKGHTLTAVIILLTGIGLAGLPPTFGFVAKISMTLLAGQVVLVGPLLIFFINSLISLYYYVKMSTTLIFEGMEIEDIDDDLRIPPSMVLAISIPFVLAVIMTILPSSWIGFL